MFALALVLFADAALTNTALADLCERQQWDAVAAITTPADVNAAQPGGMTALHWATHHGHVATVRRLLATGADPQVTTEYSITPLAIACEAGRGDLTRLLLAAGADPHDRIPTIQTMLHLAARTGSEEVTTQLLAAGVAVDRAESNDQTPLMWAAAEGHDDVCRLLLEGGADPTRTSKNGFTALMFAARHGHTAVCRRLVKAGADVSRAIRPKETWGRNPRARMSPLLLAVESAHYETALALVDLGADPNDQRSGFAPLHALSWVRRADKGDNVSGDPEPRGSGGISPLQFVRLLAEAGADVNLQLTRGSGGRAILNTKQATPLLLAAGRADVPLVSTLLDLGADPTLTNVDGSTPLLAAAGIGVKSLVDEPPGSPAECIAAVAIFRERGLDLNAVDGNGETVMHGAAYRNYPGLVRHLASIGADPAIWNRENKHGTTPHDIAAGNRPGAFKPSPPTTAALDEVLSP